MPVRHLYLLALAATLGCATTNTAGSGPPVRRSGTLTADEILAAKADVNTAYDAVARLRPNWLARKGAMTSNSEVSPYATVFIEGQLMGDVQALRNVQAYDVGDIRYYDVTEAGAKFGLRAGTAGAIEVRMKDATGR